jgi:hypothetical protein
MQTLDEWNKSKNLVLQEKVKNPTITNHLGHTWYNITTYILGFDILDVISHVLCELIELDYVL